MNAITPFRRDNLTKLADYLESLPADYAHFDMSVYEDHKGECSLLPDEDVAVIEANYLGWIDNDRVAETTLYATDPKGFLDNCGTIACALGHGPAAGVPFDDDDVTISKWEGKTFVEEIDFDRYAEKFIGDDGDLWMFLFNGAWEYTDNHHYGAAARIRYLLAGNDVPAGRDPSDYAAFRIDA